MKWRFSRQSLGVNVSQTRIRVGEEAFHIAQEYQWLAQDDTDGAVVTFTGKVRRQNQGHSISQLKLEHYPAMTQKTLMDIVQQARERWSVRRVSLIHRTGELLTGEEIVFVGVTSVHRAQAFAAAQFIMDYLKTRAPFWKRETTASGQRWVEANPSDQQAVSRWNR